jgi:serine/threonine protein kinase
VSDAIESAVFPGSMVVTAHTAAYEKAQILHRDVSAGNILIADDGSGLLIDWDLSKKVIPDVDTKPRRHSRTVWVLLSYILHTNGLHLQGTWQFISIARLRDHTSWPHEVSDDLESFFWVLLYQVAKCRAAGLNLDEEMQNVFDFHTKLDEHGIVRGGKGKLNTLRNGELDSSTIDALVNTPCRDIIRELTSLFHDFYLHLSARMDLGSLFLSKYEAKRQADPRFLHAHKRLRSSEWVLDMINGHLASEWEVDDDGSLHQTALRPDSKGSANCKKRQASDCKDDKLDSFGMQDGRMPPGFSVSSNDGLSDQGCPYSCKRIYLDPSSHDALDSSDRVSVE